MSKFPLGKDYSPLYPLDYIGYWGPVTATIDWCEENYLVSPYFAEFINSTTNLSFFILAMYHLYTTIVNRHGPLFIFIAIGMCTVGLGSWLFHMTLRYEFQLMDELPMIYVTAIPSAYIFAYNRSKWGQRMSYFGIFIFMFLLTVIYCFIWKNPILHQVCYAFLNFSIIYRSIVIIQTIVPTTEKRWFMYKILITSFSLFGFGFLVWNLDNELCSGLISLRRKYLGLPYGFILEGHGWWHIFTSWGIYYFILYMEVLVSWMEGVQDNYYINWKWGFIAQLLLKDDKQGIADKQGFGDRKMEKVD